MRIQHNIMAMSAYRNYTNNVSAMKKNLEKLSSGYKINRAGDDAAGLAISEKMRAQITGLETAQKNAKDGISLVQTAEGALTEVHDMLNRMVELATQSANGTYDNTTDRAQMQKEMDQLRSEINRIADSANFNGIKLLDGSMDGADKVTITENAAANITVSAEADGEQGAGAEAAGVYSIDLKDLKLYASGTKAITMSSIMIAGQNLVSSAGSLASTAWAADGSTTVADLIKSGNLELKDEIKIDGISYSVSLQGTKIVLTGDRAPTTKTELPGTAAAMTVSLGVSGAGHNNSFDLAVHPDTPAKIGSKDKVAQGSFSLTADHVKDGAKITIGKDTYTFKVGKDSTTEAGDGETLIDLSAYEDGDANLLKAAAEKLATVGGASNSMFDITTDPKTAGKIYLTEKAGAVDYKADWNLQGDAAAKDGKWNENVNGDANSGVVKFQAAPTKTITAGPGKSLTLQIGDTADGFNQLKVNIGDTHCDALGIDAIKISDQTSAAAAVDAIKDAINKVSDIRGTLGATQNRLDHTINNLSVMTENIQDAESTIRDTDVAEEMMAYTKNNILIQSAQAMLAQANQVPQGVLQLLQ